MPASHERQLLSLMRELERGRKPRTPTKLKTFTKTTPTAASAKTAETKPELKPVKAESREVKVETAPAKPASRVSGKTAAQDKADGVVLRLTGVRKEYEMGTQTLAALDGIDLVIRKGESVAIMGPSGSGKSTMLHILGLLDRPSSGELFLDGVNVGQTADEELAKIRGEKIGFVFQSFFLIPTLSAWENVALPMMFDGVPLSEREKRAKDLLKKVGLGDRMMHLPSELSGGQRQRVAIARALSNNPAIILADEPTGNLDSKSGQDILKLFDELHKNEGRTLVIVTHDPDMREHVQRAVHLKDGRVERDEKSR